VTAAARQQRAHERHRAFLANVTGLQFFTPYLDPVHGLVFQAIAPVLGGAYIMFLKVESRVADPKDFVS